MACNDVGAALLGLFLLGCIVLVWTFAIFVIKDTFSKKINKDKI